MTAAPDSTTAGMEYAPDLELALRAADAADAITLGRFGAADLRVDAKPDRTPVSEADLAAETAIRGLLDAHRPADGVAGEEFGEVNRGSARRWVLDPIDGTKNYVRGVPVWATLIALLVDGEPVVGVVSAPALARRWWARRGGGAFSSFAAGPAQPLTTSGVSALSDASVSYSDLAEWESAGLGSQFGGLIRQAWRSRGYGDFFSYMLVAQGSVDIAAEPQLSLWDLAALAPVVTEAGGTFTDVLGRPVGPASTSALASNGPLHPLVLAALSE